MFSRINNNTRANDGGNSGNNCGDGNVEYNNNNFPVHNQMLANFANLLSANSQQEQHQNHRKMSTCTASSFDVIRSSDSFSSMFSAISPSSPINRSPNPFTAHFEAINRLPLNHWLKGKNMEAAAEEDEEDNEEMMDQFEETNGGNGGESIMQGLTTMLANLESIRPKLEQTDAQLKAMTAELKRMILLENSAVGQKRIVEQQKTMMPPPIHPQTLFTFQPPKLTTIEKGGGNEFEREILEEETTKLVEKLPQIALKLPSDPAHWLKKYPPPKQNRPMNEMAEDVSCWESVLGWKRILEKIHASGEHVWLAPSSRSIKN